LVQSFTELENQPSIKVDNLYSVSFLSGTPIFEWRVVVCGFKNGYQKVMCLEDLDCMLNILGSRASISEGAYMTI